MFKTIWTRILRFGRKIFPLIKIVLFMLIVVLIEFWRMQYKDFSNGLTQDQFDLIEQSKITHNSDVLVMGDSVASQVFGNDQETDSYYSMTGNCASTMGGQYLLLRNYLEKNPQTKKVYLVVTPDLLGNNGDAETGYQYYIIPYYNEENMQYITEDVQNHMDKVYGKIFTRNETMRKMLYNDYFILDKYIGIMKRINRNKDIGLNISWLSATYLHQINELCCQKEVELEVIPPNLRDCKKMHDWKQFNEDVKMYELQEILGNYSSNVQYMKEEYFEDEYHYKWIYVSEKRQELINSILYHDNMEN